jgi:hypothetical protein
MSSLPTVQENKSVFFSVETFELGQRMAKVLAESKLIPVNYQKNLPDCVIALELAQRIGASPMAVMQNTHVIHGRPGYSAQFVIAMINSCGRYSPLRFEITGEGDDQECYAWAYELSTGDKLTGPPCSIKMAKAEGWFQKSGSKWQTMPEVMLRYRAAAFFGRIYAPELLTGMRTVEELADTMRGEEVAVKESLNERFAKAKVIQAEVVEVAPPTPPPAPPPPAKEEETGEVDMAIFEKEVAALNKISDPTAVDKWRLKNSDRVLNNYASGTATAILDHADMVYRILSAEAQEA